MSVDPTIDQQKIFDMLPLSPEQRRMLFKKLSMREAPQFDSGPQSSCEEPSSPVQPGLQCPANSPAENQT